MTSQAAIFSDPSDPSKDCKRLRNYSQGPKRYKAWPILEKANTPVKKVANCQDRLCRRLQMVSGVCEMVLIRCQMVSGSFEVVSEGVRWCQE